MLYSKRSSDQQFRSLKYQKDCEIPSTIFGSVRFHFSVQYRTGGPIPSCKGTYMDIPGTGRRYEHSYIGGMPLCIYMYDSTSRRFDVRPHSVFYLWDVKPFIFQPRN
jgi:hypothetical protein